MNFRKILTLSIIIFALGFSAYGQVDPAEAPRFGGTRSLNPALVHNFKAVSGIAHSYEFKITNEGSTTMKIVDIQIPDKVGVTLFESSIKKGKEGTIRVTVDPTIMKKGVFDKRIIVVTEQVEPSITIRKEMTFVVRGEIK